MLDYSDTESILSASSTESDFGLSILNEIKQGLYVCLVCTDEIDESSAVWLCKSCFRVYDLDCIKGWAKRDSDSRPDLLSWRCPLCKAETTEMPSKYTCWCGKVSNPPQNPFSPHSCGQTCLKPLKSCPHGCSLACHPGPHSEVCQALPRLQCDCGACTKQFPCSMAPYKENWRCDTVCGQLMPCGEHVHQDTCHSGLCGTCKEPIEASCYCGKQRSTIFCGEKVPIGSGMYSCKEPCQKTLDCGIHKCKVDFCHPVSRKYPHTCPLAPEAVKTCPCGKSAVSELLLKEREKCTDPVPTCNKVCGKPLPCGHLCYWTCHEGECSPCYRTVEMKCRCTFHSFLVPCAFKKAGEVPKCQRKCQTLKNCRRHRCLAICCPYEPVAMKREQDRRKNQFKSVEEALALADTRRTRQDAIMTIEAAHICTETCNRLLNCGIHRCRWQDHAGKCEPCLESLSDDLLCACGRTVLIEAPVRCGAIPTVSCKYPCHRPRPCGHDAPHPCHSEDVPCSRCTQLVSKLCRCGKRTIKGVYCFQELVSCGQKCGKKLQCGIHECSNVCCDKGIDHSKIKCEAVCMKQKLCGHPDTARCHWPETECDESKPCTAKVKIFCDCRRQMEVKACGAVAGKESAEKTKLACDEECLRLLRNQQLLEAFNLDVGSTGPYLDYIMGVFVKQRTWCERVEKTFRKLVNDWKQQPAVSDKAFNFPPMNHPQRKFIHHLSDVYGLFSQSHDPEPHRSVMVKITEESHVPGIMMWEVALAKERPSVRKEARKTVNALKIYPAQVGATASEIESLVADAASTVALLSDWKASCRGVENHFIVQSENPDRDIRVVCARLKERGVDVECCLVGSDGQLQDGGSQDEKRDVDTEASNEGVGKADNDAKDEASNEVGTEAEKVQEDTNEKVEIEKVEVMEKTFEENTAEENTENSAKDANADTEHRDESASSDNPFDTMNNEIEQTESIGNQSENSEQSADIQKPIVASEGVETEETS